MTKVLAGRPDFVPSTLSKSVISDIEEKGEGGVEEGVKTRGTDDSDGVLGSIVESPSKSGEYSRPAKRFKTEGYCITLPQMRDLLAYFAHRHKCPAFAATGFPLASQSFAYQ